MKVKKKSSAEKLTVSVPLLQLPLATGVLLVEHLETEKRKETQISLYAQKKPSLH